MTDKIPTKIASKIRVDASSCCWLWTGALRLGYGYFSEIRVHRLTYELCKGRIPDGLVIDHLCRQKSCVNPDHLEAVPQKLNLERGENFIPKQKFKTHCPSGHPYHGGNLYVKPNGTRGCRICYRRYRATYLQKRKELAR